MKPLQVGIEDQLSSFLLIPNISKFKFSLPYLDLQKKKKKNSTNKPSIGSVVLKVVTVIMRKFCQISVLLYRRYRVQNNRIG